MILVVLHVVDIDTDQWEKSEVASYKGITCELMSASKVKIMKMITAQCPRMNNEVMKMGTVYNAMIIRHLPLTTLMGRHQDLMAIKENNVPGLGGGKLICGQSG